MYDKKCHKKISVTVWHVQLQWILMINGSTNTDQLLNFDFFL